MSGFLMLDSVAFSSTPWLNTTLYLQPYDSFGNAGIAQEGIVLE